MKSFRDHGGLLESVVILFIMLFTFAVPEPTEAISDDSQVAYDIVEVASDVESIGYIEKNEVGELAEKFEYTTYSAPVYSNSGSSYSAPQGNYVSILGRNLGLAYGYIEADGHTLHVYDGIVAHYRSFYYGHNDILAGLGGLGNGSTFSIYEDGVMHNYRVASVKMVLKGDINMSNMLNARDNGVRHSISFMTCAGTPLPGRDATHRILLFADEI